jgi:hypothetical protein
MKKEYIGWVSKSEASEKSFEDAMPLWKKDFNVGEDKYLAPNNTCVLFINRTKGKKDNWHPENWPPVKVKVTVSIEKI